MNSCSLIFLLAVATTIIAIPMDGVDGDGAMGTSLSSMGRWVEKAHTTKAGAVGEAVVGTGDNIYIAWCRDYKTPPEFWCYDPGVDEWNYSMNISGLPTGAFRNGVALAWDRGDYIYALLGARYEAEDDERSLFYRYRITNESWERLADTSHAQGAGNAIAWSGYDGGMYALLGNKNRGSIFARYSYNTWEELPLNPNWTSTDDGASLVWTGGEYLYALRGEWQEKIPDQDFARFHIPTKTWEDLNPIPESEGVGDGAALHWIGDWLREYTDYIFALGGGSCLEDHGYNFYSYGISSGSWEQLEPVLCPIGWYVGNRLGFADEHIYYWQGTPSSWDCGGTAFYMFERYSPIFDTGAGTYPSIFGTHNGTITSSQTIEISGLYTYPCEGTGGHTEYAKIYNDSWSVETLPWKGYKADWHNVSFDETFTLVAHETYNYTIRTGSYPQIHHNRTLTVQDGVITCAEFVDANGKRYNDWIPAIRLGGNE